MTEKLQIVLISVTESLSPWVLESVREFSNPWAAYAAKNAMWQKKHEKCNMTKAMEIICWLQIYNFSKKISNLRLDLMWLNYNWKDLYQVLLDLYLTQR